MIHNFNKSGADKDVAKEVRDCGHDKKLPFKSKED